MRRTPLLATVAALILLACQGPTQRDPSRFGVFRVMLGGSPDGVVVWRVDQLAVARRVFAADGDDALGPDFVEVLDGESDVVAEAATLDGPCELFEVTAAGAMRLRVDASCMARGYSALQRALGHGVGHAYTWRRFGYVGHVCDWPLLAPAPATCHPTIRCAGDGCLMSRGLARIDDGPGFNEAYTGDLADPAPAQPDLDLFAHCLAAGRCEP